MGCFFRGLDGGKNGMGIELEKTSINEFQK